MVTMRTMLRRSFAVIACVTVVFLGSAGTAGALERVPGPPAVGNPAPQSICEIWPIFWWCE